jgi:hypothetical protein
MNNFPKSAYEQLGGIVYFARMLDKIHLYAAAKLHAATLNTGGRARG